MRQYYFLLISIVLISSCAYASKMNRLSLGMSKGEVIKLLGEPTSAKAVEGEEILEYRFYTEYWRYDLDSYWVILENSKVIKYGKAGDWGTVLPETYRIEYKDLNK